MAFSQLLIRPNKEQIRTGIADTPLARLIMSFLYSGPFSQLHKDMIGLEFLLPDLSGYQKLTSPLKWCVKSARPGASTFFWGWFSNFQKGTGGLFRGLHMVCVCVCD